MARTRKSIQPLNLYKYDVLVEDRGVRSDYFKLSQFDGYFYGGRNAFLAAGASAFKPNSTILVEVLDKDGNTIYSEPVQQFIEGNSRLLQVEVYSDTPPGPGKLVLLGSIDTYLNGQPIPSEWKDKYNIRWISDVIISPRIENKTPIRFLKSPEVIIAEKFYTAPGAATFSQSIDLPVSIEFSPKYYNIFPNGYVLKIPDNYSTEFNELYLNATITGSIRFSDGLQTQSANINLPITKIYNNKIAETQGALVYTDKNNLFLGGLIKSGGMEYNELLNPFGNTVITSSLSIKYNKLQTQNTGSSVSFASIRLVNLKTISGEVKKIRISHKPATDPGEYVLLGDVITNVEELLRVDSGSKIVQTGKFTDVVLSDYWYAETMSLQKNTNTPTPPDYYLSASLAAGTIPLIQTSNYLLNSIQVTPLIQGNKFLNNSSYFIGTTRLNTVELFPNSEYTLSFKAIVAKESASITLDQVDSSMEIYLVKDDNGFDGRILERDLRGQLIGTVTPDQLFKIQNFGTVELNFSPAINSAGKFGLRFIVYGGFWNIADVSVKPAQEQFFSPDEVEFIVPNINYAGKVLSFKFQYLDINNNSSAVETISLPTYFSGSTVPSNISNINAVSGEVSTIFYVSPDGSDINDGKTLNTAFRTIKKATIAASASIAANPGFPPYRVSIQVKTGYYVEEAPITVPPFTSILGDDLRTVVVKPTTVTKTENLFLMNNATYMWGLRFEGCTIDNLEDPRKGFFIAFAPGASISTSPYVQNCSATFADPQYFYTPLDQPNGNPLIPNGPGGMIVDDSVLDGYSPLKSMIVDAYTQVAFNGIGICIRGSGYAQLVSFFTNFSRVGVYAIDGGHASLLNSNTTFGDYGLRSVGKRILVVPNINGLSTYTNSIESGKITGSKAAIQNYMITQLQTFGNYASSYSDVNSAAYKSTIKDSGLLIDALAADLLVPSASRLSNFVQGLFKGQDVSTGNIYTLPSATGFDKGAIAVFRVNDSNQMAHDFTASFHYINEYVQNSIPTLHADAKLKVSQSLELAKTIIKSVVIDVQPTYLQEFGSLVTSTSHDFSYAGAGVNFLALPPNQFGIGQTNTAIRVVQENGGRVFHTSGDETGDFFAGQDFVIRQATGTIEGRTFNKALLARVTPLSLALETI